MERIYNQYGLRPFDEIKAIDGKNVTSAWDFAEIEKSCFKPEAALTVSRQWPNTDEGQRSMTTVNFPVVVSPTVSNFRNELDLAHFGSMVPRLKVDAVIEPPAIVSVPKRVMNWVSQHLLRRQPSKSTSALALQKGDILLKIGDQEFPTYKQLREVTTAYKDKELPLVVLRKNKDGQAQTVEVTMQPKIDPASERVVMRIVPILDMHSTVIARTINAANTSGQAVDIPAGAAITSVAGTPVKSFFEIASLLQDNAGKKVAIQFEHAGQPGQATLTLPELEPVHAEATISISGFFADLKEEFKASNPVEAVQMGGKKAWQFVWQSYVTLGRLFQRSVSVSALSGPVGIISMTYEVTRSTVADYLYFLALISSCLAVMNLLPLPVLDGGHILILLIEKISGRPINERVLAGAMYVGMAFLLGFILFITYKDLIRILY
jgi:RIP metalloprotease RseP